MEPAEDGTAAVELGAEIVVPREEGVIRHATQHGVADVAAAAVLDIAANRVATARLADESHARRSGAAIPFLDSVTDLPALVLGRGFVRLPLGIIPPPPRLP